MNSSYDESLLQPAIVETIVQMHARPTPTERRLTIPDAAIEHAADAIWDALHGDCHAVPGSPEHCGYADYHGAEIYHPVARAALEAALPHLGESETTYTTRIQHSGGTLVQEDGATRDLASAQARAARLNWGPNAAITVVQRTVYWSEWTEVET